MEINRPGDSSERANPALMLAEAHLFVAVVQQEIVVAQAVHHAVRRPDRTRCCGEAEPAHVRAMARVAFGQPIAQQLARRSLRAEPCRVGYWHFEHRRRGKLPAHSATEQVAAEVLLASRCQSQTAVSLQRLDYNCRFGFRQRFRSPHDRPRQHGRPPDLHFCGPRDDGGMLAEFSLPITGHH
jgi:hypothetical protein